jgi:lysophospholipase L1-like esterase
MLDDFVFIIAMVNDASKEKVEKKEVKQEHMYNHIEIELQGVQQALQSSHAVPTAPLITRIVEPVDELAQLHRIADMGEARLRQAQEDIAQATQALTQI